jgi:tRNA-specific adenosine deaminase 3
MADFRAEVDDVARSARVPTGPIRPATGVEVRASPVGGPGGRGVFATAMFVRGHVIEESPVLDYGPARSYGPEDPLYEYCLWDAYEEGRAVCMLGLGMLYNSSDDPNMVFVRCPQRRTLLWVARRTIMPGDEITFRYAAGWKPSDGEET